MVTLVSWSCPFGLMCISSNGFLELLLGVVHNYLMVFEKESSNVVFRLLPLGYHLNHTLNLR